MHSINNKILLYDNSRPSIKELLKSESYNYYNLKFKESLKLSNIIYTKTTLYNKKYNLVSIDYLGENECYKIKFKHSDDIYIFDRNQSFQIITEDRILWLPLHVLIYTNFHYNILSYSENYEVIITSIESFNPIGLDHIWQLRLNIVNNIYYYMLSNGVITKDYNSI